MFRSRLLHLLFVGALLLIATSHAGPPDWPPQHMQALPPNYLERLKACMNAGTERLTRMKTGESQSSDSIGWVRYGQPSLLLGRRADEINAFFESDKFEWNANPKFGFSLFTVSFMRLYAIANPRTGSCKGLLSDKAIENFERGMWKVAKANSKLAEAKRGVWEVEGSENHHLASKTCDFLAAQFLRNLPAYASQSYDDGSTPAQQYDVRHAYWMRWIDERAKHGQFVEAGSPSYQGDSMNALFNLRDFAEDEVLRRKAGMYLDLAFAVMAEETLLTTRGGPKSRVKVGHEYDGGFANERSYNTLFNAPGREFLPLGENTLSTSDYYPPPAIVSLASDTQTRGTYSFTTRWPGPVAEGGGRDENDADGRLWRTLDPQRSVLRRGFATPDYILGSAALHPAFTDDTSSGFRWQGVVFAGDPLARIGFEVVPSKSKDWHGFHPFFSLQDRNVLITRAWAPVPPNPTSAHPAHLRVYFSPTLDEVTEEGGWIFVKDGGAFAAVKVVAGGYEWTPAWQHAGTVSKDNRAFITLNDENAAVILVVNQASDYGGNIDAFKAALKAEPIEHRGDTVKFAALAFHGLAKPGEINGKPVDLTPASGYDSPFIRSDWGSGVIHILKGDETVILDFSDPQNPKKIIGPPVTDAFPPGIGSTPAMVMAKDTR